MKEVWRDIVDYEGLYQVSNLGNIKRENRMLNKIKHSAGYLKVILCKNSVTKNCYIHRLVAKAFIPNPDNKKTVNHKNGIKTDNRVENLEWCTFSENSYHSFRSLGRLGAVGERGGKAKLTEKDVLEIRSCFKNRKYGDTIKLARKFNVSVKNINCIWNRKSWKYI